MGLYTELPETIHEVDVIIAGGGTAGCVVAARLAEADPDLSILVIEGGRNNDSLTIRVPALLMANLVPDTKTNIFYQGAKEKQLGDREVIVPSGGVLGGGSSTNLMMYSRAQRSDFDSWDVPGWSADEMLPYLKKLETYHGPDSNGTHGYDGPVQISGGTYCVTRFQNQFLSAVKQLGWPEIEDLQNLESCNGAQRALRTISPDGQRQDTASRYLHPKLHGEAHPNLHVVVESQVIRVVVDDGRAVGVEFRRNPLFNKGDEASSRARMVKASKTVVVSCGALGTPLVLERSGLGDPAVLERAGVPLAVSLPGVGHECEDHQLNVYPYRSSLDPEDTLDALVGGRLDVGALIQNKDKILGWNAMDVTCKLRPSKADVAALGPAFQEAWDRDFEQVPDRPLAMINPVNGFPGDPSTVPAGQYFAVSTFTTYPYSRGHIHITGPDPSDRLDFETGFFSDPHGIDIKKHVWLYKTQREIARRMDVYRGEVPGGHPPFPAGSNAAPVELADGPLSGEVSNIVYTAEDDAILEQWLRANVGTTWHSCGTCKMAPREKNGVVDGRLNVYGVKGLKIADLSILPRNVAANTCNTAMAIGEKAADIIIGDLGLGKTV